MKADVSFVPPQYDPRAEIRALEDEVRVADNRRAVAEHTVEELRRLVADLGAERPDSDRMAPAELDALCIVMRKHRVLKCGDVELSPLAFVVATAEEPTLQRIGMEHGNPTEDELLFMSSLPITPEERDALTPRKE